MKHLLLLFLFVQSGIGFNVFADSSSSTKSKALFAVGGIRFEDNKYATAKVYTDQRIEVLKDDASKTFTTVSTADWTTIKKLLSALENSKIINNTKMTCLGKQMHQLWVPGHSLMVYPIDAVQPKVIYNREQNCTLPDSRPKSALDLKRAEQIINLIEKIVL